MELNLPGCNSDFSFVTLYCANGRGRFGGQTAGRHPKASPRPRQPLFAVSALRELESACRVSILWDAVAVPTVCFSGALRGSPEGVSSSLRPKPSAHYIHAKIFCKLFLVAGYNYSYINNCREKYFLHTPLFPIVKCITYYYIDNLFENYFCCQATITITRIITLRIVYVIISWTTVTLTFGLTEHPCMLRVCPVSAWCRCACVITPLRQSVGNEAGRCPGTGHRGC